MEQRAQGFVEVTGYVAAIEVADVMAKAAEVAIVMAHKVDGPNICVVCEGDVAACQAAVSAGKAWCESRGTLIGVNVISRPAGGSGELHSLLAAMKARKAAKKAERLAKRSKPAPAAPAAGAGSAAKKAKKEFQKVSKKEAKKSTPKHPVK